ncbi:MAG: sensor histidine kinase, partial [Terriglobales bacterium]
YEIQAEPECLRAKMPNLLLQPLVENAMKHGISRDPDARLVRISARREGGELILEVYNDGSPLRDPEGGAGAGIGLQNVRARLGLMYGSGSSLTLRNHPHRGVSAVIRLPFQPKT